MAPRLNPLLDPDLTNALTDSVIDAAKAARIVVPPGISALHSHGNQYAPNRWHVASGAANRDEVIPPGTRQRALDELSQLNRWAVDIRDSVAFQAALAEGQSQQRQRRPAPGAGVNKMIDRAVAISDALQPHVLEQVFVEPELAREKIKADFEAHDDLGKIAAQLERTPDVYGALLSHSRFAIHSGSRQTALAAIQEHMIKPLRAVTGEKSVGPNPRPMEVRRPEAGPGLNHHLIAFDEAVTKLEVTHDALIASKVQDDIRLQRQIGNGQYPKQPMTATRPPRHP